MIADDSAGRRESVADGAPRAADPPPPEAASVLLPSIANFRDIGGFRVRSGGRVRSGLCYRSVDLGRLDDHAVSSLAALGIRTVYDLRTHGERALRPDRIPPGSRLIVRDLLADAAGRPPAEMQALFADPIAAREILSSDEGSSFFVRTYRELVTLPSARSGLGLFLMGLADADLRPALVHCTTGKDRTGWAVAVLLTLLDVPPEDVLADYLASGPQLQPLFEPMLVEFARRGGDPELLRPLVEVRADYLAAAFDEVRARFTSFEEYVRDGLELDERTIAAIRGTFIEGAAPQGARNAG